MKTNEPASPVTQHKESDMKTTTKDYVVQLVIEAAWAA